MLTLIFSLIIGVIGIVCYLDLRTYGKYNKYGGKKAIVSHRGIPPFGVGLDFIGITTEGKLQKWCQFKFKNSTKN